MLFRWSSQPYANRPKMEELSYGASTGISQVGTTFSDRCSTQHSD